MDKISYGSDRCDEIIALISDALKLVEDSPDYTENFEDEICMICEIEFNYLDKGKILCTKCFAWASCQTD